MKKLSIFFMVIMLTIVGITSSLAISVDELRSNPQRYQLVFSGQVEDEYVDNTTISVIRYAPPYYIINATAYAITYNNNFISKYENTYFYDYDQSLFTLSKYLSSNNALRKEVESNSGIKWRVTGLTIYNFDGSIKAPYIYFDPIKIDKTSSSKIFSPSYQSALYAFYKSYNVRFNPPSYMDNY